MLHFLASLHDANNSGVNQRLAVLLYVAPRLALLWLSFLLRSSTSDLDLDLLGSEGFIDAELVFVFY